MNVSVPSAPLPVRVLFLSRDESFVRTDTKLLRSLGVSAITHVNQSSQATAFLEKHPPKSDEDATPAAGSAHPVDIVISDEHLADAPASVFLYGLAKHPALKSQPVLVLTGSSESSRRLRSAGVYLLERPYTAQGLARMLQKAMSPVRRVLRADAFEAVSAQKGMLLQPRPQRSKPAAPVTTSDWFKKGLEHLRADRLREAEQAFVHVLDRQEDHVDAALGLARVHRAKGDENAMRRCLLRATATSLREGDKVRAARIAAMLPATMRDKIFFYEALARMEDGEFKAAALGFLDASKESSDTPLHHIVSRACLLTAKPEDRMRRLCAAFAGMGHKATAERLHQRLLVYPEFTPDESPSWLDAYPKLRDAVDVVAGTALAWRHA